MRERLVDWGLSSRMAACFMCGRACRETVVRTRGAHPRVRVLALA